MSRAGWPRGRYTRLFYRCRLCERFPRLFPPYECTTNFLPPGAVTTPIDLSLRIDQPASDLSVASGVFGEREYWFEDLPSVKTILDLGSNIGCTALWFSRVADRPTIACVEADPRNVPLLQENLQKNGVQHRVFTSAVGAAAGTAEFAFGAHAGCGTLAQTGMHGHAQTVKVSVQTIPMLLDAMNWPMVDLIKMDVEGAELALFQHATDWLPRTQRVVMEIHPNTSPEEIQGLARPYGFWLQRIGFSTEPTFLLSRQ